MCLICLDDIIDHVNMNCCKNTYCKECLDEALKHSPYCPTCKTPLREVKGNQPAGTMDQQVLRGQSLPGHRDCDMIKITYYFPSGTQGHEHPNPGIAVCDVYLLLCMWCPFLLCAGKRYTGTSRTAYLPNNKEGQHVLQLLRKAFDAGVLFTIGTSVTTGIKDTIVWNDVHHKTSISGGPYVMIQLYGY